MKKIWEISEFENCLEKVVYTNKIQRKDFLESGKFPIISQEQDFINGYWNNEDDLFKIKKPVVIFGDHTKVIKFVDFDFILGADGVKILQTKQNIEPKYFYYFLQNVNLKSLGYARHYRLLKKLNVWYPKSLPEQQRIVSILDETFAAIAKAKANAEQNLKNAKELFESYLESIFVNKGEDWEEKPLGEVIQKTETIDPTKNPDNSFKYIDVSSVNNEKFEVEATTLINGKDAPSRARKLVKINDVIFATVRPTLKRVAVITEEYNEQICSTGYFVLRAKDIINYRLIFYFLLTDRFINKMDKLQKGASYPAVTESDVKCQIIPFPKSTIEQQSIVQKLDVLSAETKKLEAIYQKKIEDLEELKKSILQKAFAGELKTTKSITG
jgi:type I restriction enzyme S subunit